MRRLILTLWLLGSTALFSADDTGVLGGLNESGGLAGGALGIGAIHGIFWVPIILFFIVAGAVIGFYFKQFKQKDDGLYKTIASIVVGVVFGVLVYAGALKLIDSIFASKGCGSDIITAYMKDSVKTGLSPSSYVFGTTIKSVPCLQ